MACWTRAFLALVLAMTLSVPSSADVMQGKDVQVALLLRTAATCLCIERPTLRQFTLRGASADAAWDCQLYLF